MWFGVLQVVQDLLIEQHIARLSPEAADKFRKDREEFLEKSRVEEIAEQRHRELCDAIRWTRY